MTHAHAMLGTTAQPRVRILTSASTVRRQKVKIIPATEVWLWSNPAALAAVQHGLRQAADGQVDDWGSFAQYCDLDVDDV